MTAAGTAPKRSRKERQLTPEDAETQTVDHRELRMGDLTKDLRIGKKFSLHDELVDRQREKRRKSRQNRLKKTQDGDGAGSDAGSVVGGGGSETGSTETGGTGQPRGMSEAAAAAASVMAAAARRGAAAAAVAGPQFEIIDGNIVVNQASLVHDRHARRQQRRASWRRWRRTTLRGRRRRTRT